MVGGGLDLAETSIIARRAYKWFFEGDFSVGDKSIDVEPLGGITDLQE